MNTILHLIGLLVLVTHEQQSVYAIDEVITDDMTNGLTATSINRHLKLASYMNPLARAPNRSTLAVGYFERDVIELLASTLNFTYESVLTPDVVGPGVVVNGQWNGCVGQVQRKEVDFCASFVQTWESSEKTGQFDFPFPIMWDYIGLITPRPQQRDKSLIIFAPFQPLAWLLILVAAAIVTVLIWISYVYQEGVYQPSLPFSRWVLFTVSTLSMGERGFVLYHDSNDTFTPVYRLMIVFWCWPLLILTSVYRGVLFSMLTVPEFIYLVNDIKELPARPEISVYVWKGSAIDEYFVGLKDGPYKSIGEQLRRYPEQRLPQGDLDRLFQEIDGQRVFLIAKTICESIMIEDAKRNNPPRLYMPDSEVFLPRGRQITLQRGSRMTPIFDARILLLQQHGLIDYANRRNLKLVKGQRDPSKRKEHNRVFVLSDFTGPFILLTIGLTSAILLYLSETLRYWKKHKTLRWGQQ